MVRELVNGARTAGTHAEPWDQRDASGRAVCALDQCAFAPIVAIGLRDLSGGRALKSCVWSM